MADELDIAEETVPEGPSRKRRPLWKRLLIGFGITVVVLAVLAAALYFFGGMSGSANDPAMKQQYEQLVASGQVQPVTQRLVIPIPGCTCHSQDPVLTEQHRNRRIRDCMGCHGG